MTLAIDSTPWMVNEITKPRQPWVPIADGNAQVVNVVRSIMGMGFVDVPTAAKACGLSISMTRTYLSAALDLGYVERRKTVEGAHLYCALDIFNPVAVAMAGGA